MIKQTFRNSTNRTAREQWLSERRTCLGASDTPAILGVGYSTQSPWSVWESKVLDLPIEGWKGPPWLCLLCQGEEEK